jgi:agmatine deiminase
LKSEAPAKDRVQGVAHLAAERWRMPAEWEPHEATWIAWPHHRDDWPGKFAAIEWVYVETVRHLHRSELVRVMVNDEAAAKRARRKLASAGVDLSRVAFITIVTDRSWTRDYGPIFVKGSGGALAVANWRFSGWAKYANWQNDDAVAAQAAEKLGVPIIEPAFQRQRACLEGGAIDVNGQGLVLTTEECLLSEVQSRNPELGQADLDELFRRYLGIEKVIWLGAGIAGDDTHGHVDDIARFVDTETIVAVREPKIADANHAPLLDNWDRLNSARDLEGRTFNVVELPMPEPVVFKGQRLPASYANFYIANDRVLVPTFNDPNDRRALGILKELFPGRHVIGIHAVDLVWGLGTIHCLTQQQPRSAKS